MDHGIAAVDGFSGLAAGIAGDREHLVLDRTRLRKRQQMRDPDRGPLRGNEEEIKPLQIFLCTLLLLIKQSKQPKLQEETVTLQKQDIQESKPEAGRACFISRKPLILFNHSENKGQIFLKQPLLMI